MTKQEAGKRPAKNTRAKQEKKQAREDHDTRQAFEEGRRPDMRE